MEHWRGTDEIPASWGRCVLTIGVFDGVHRGHQALIREAVATGRSHGLPTVLMTFDPHPAEVVRPGSHPAQLTTLRRRAELVAELGIDAFLVLPFTPALSQVTAEEFVHDVIVDRLHAANVVVGENFRFGHRGAGLGPLLRELGPRFGFTVNGIELVTEPDEVTVTSTYVRSCVAAGDVRAATEALGRPHRVEGFVVPRRGPRRHPAGLSDRQPGRGSARGGAGRRHLRSWFTLGGPAFSRRNLIGSDPTSPAGCVPSRHS